LEGKLKLNSMSGALITKKLLEKIKEQLNDRQKNYVEFRGNAEKMVGGVDFLKTFLKTQWIFIVYLLLFVLEVIIRTIDFQESNLFYHIKIIIHILFFMISCYIPFFYILYKEEYKEECEKLAKTIEKTNTLDFLLSIQNKITQEEYNNFYKFIEEQNLFKKPIVKVIIEAENNFKKIELEKERETERMKKEEVFNKKKFLAKMNVYEKS
jgi:hypothetical protein